MTDFSNDKSAYLPGLEERFTPPAGWEWHVFKSPRGYGMRFGFVMPPGRKPDAIVVGLQGLSDFSEKYFETARGMTAKNLGFFMMDWRGQGKSDRGAAPADRRHSVDFQDDIDDLHYFITQHVRPRAGHAPLAMIAHSMGANIGLRYIAAHPGILKAAAFSAPMFGIHALRNIPRALSLGLTCAVRMLLNKKPVGFGSSAWSPVVRDDPALNIFSNDEIRRKVHNAWCLHDPALQCGGITYGWLDAANRSCANVFEKNVLMSVDIPVLIALAGQEKLVDNAAARAVAKILPRAKIIEFAQAKHELLMERDDVRAAFMAEFFSLLQGQAIPVR